MFMNIYTSCMYVYTYLYIFMYEKFFTGRDTSNFCFTIIPLIINYFKLVSCDLKCA